MAAKNTMTQAEPPLFLRIRQFRPSNGFLVVVNRAGIVASHFGLSLFFALPDDSYLERIFSTRKS